MEHSNESNYSDDPLIKLVNEGESYFDAVKSSSSSLKNLVLFLSNPSENLNKYTEDFITSGKFTSCLITVKSALNSCLKGEDVECVDVLLELDLEQVRDTLGNATSSGENVIFISRINELISLQAGVKRQTRTEL
ncbi:hypothetical protein KC669_04440 [Candidatus Dojkabacteria bacterium]|uniref:Uncharacterized protein n=1 Tax=Candidatus Dojkabacteria bacterium TaxID=2099670 RepID=A0A955LBT9_9BACT|nr:hypothetical protein [Candidatus Dojkabacteria bacterium]